MISVQEQLSDSIKALSRQTPVIVSGRVNRYDGQMVECDGFPATIGSLCEIETETNLPAIAEIIGFHGGHNLLSLHDYGARISVGAKVKVVDDGYTIAVGDGLLGRVTDALGSPLDEKPISYLNDQWPLLGKELNPLSKNPVNEPLDVGVRSINSLLSVGRGQRLGIIAGSGVGKSVLLGMMCKYTEADIVVVGMIGERGREVGSFVNNILSGESKKRTAVVAVPADRSPLLRIRGAERATAIAEYFRDKGKNVLLIMDSLTRVAHARREIGLALGEQPTSKGYPPSVVSMIPRLIERTGSGVKNQGSITAIYTVLAEGDDTSDPVVDIARASLDGQVMLSRKLADMAHYPAIDLAGSVSRVMPSIVSGDRLKKANQFRRFWTLYQQNMDLIQVGAYEPGTNPELDEAIKIRLAMEGFLLQGDTESFSFEQSQQLLMGVMGV